MGTMTTNTKTTTTTTTATTIMNDSKKKNMFRRKVTFSDKNEVRYYVINEHEAKNSHRNQLRQQIQLNPQQQQQQQQQHNHHQIRRGGKKKFLLFADVLMKYLQLKDPIVFEKVKRIIKECIQRKKHQENGFKTLTPTIVYKQLQKVVPKEHWDDVELLFWKMHATGNI